MSGSPCIQLPNMTLDNETLFAICLGANLLIAKLDSVNFQIYCMNFQMFKLDLEKAEEPAKVCLVKAVVFPVVMYGYESWTRKKAECCRVDAFELRCWRSLLTFPWTARRCNQSILKEISSEYSLDGLMLKLKLQYFGRLMQRNYSLEKTLMLGKIEGGRKRG